MSLSIKVIEYEQVDDYIEFVIEVSQKESGEAWRFKRRYSQLRDIHKQFKSLDSRVPEFPPKKLFGSKNPKFLLQRKSDIENYLIEVSKLSKLMDSSFAKDFFRPKDARIISTSPTSPTQTYKKPNQVPGFQNYINQLNDSISNKFFDLSAQPAPPETEDVKRQQKLFESLANNLKIALKTMVPEGSHINQAYHNTTVVKQKWIRSAFKETRHKFRESESHQLLVSFK